MGLSIYRESDDFSTFTLDSSDDRLVAGSVPGKYHSYIQPISLTRGSYIFVVAPEQQVMSDDTEILMRFSLDFVYERENITRDNDMMMETMELCGLPSFPESLNSP